MFRLIRLGGRRAWIIFCTVTKIATQVVSALIDFKANFGLLLAMVGSTGVRVKRQSKTE